MGRGLRHESADPVISPQTAAADPLLASFSVVSATGPTFGVIFGGWFIDVMPEQFVCLTLTPMARGEDPNRQSPRQAAVKHAVADASWKVKVCDFLIHFESF